MAKDMQVLYKGLPVQTVSLILLKIANAGTEPIRESDYSEPIRVLMSPTAAVGEVSVQETRPDGIQLSPMVTASNRVELAKVLLNPGDQVVLKILALNNDSTLHVEARIAGIRTLDIQSVLERDDLSGRRTINTLLGGLIAFLILILIGFIVWQSRPLMEWRRRQFGFDPARYHYTDAQRGMLTLPGSEGTVQASNTIAQVVRSLDRCFAWDSAYLETVKTDPLFSQLLGYGPFKDVVDRYTARISRDSSDG